MWILIVGLLFLAGAIWNTVHPDYAEATVGYAISLVCFTVYLYFRAEDRRSAEFLHWLGLSGEHLRTAPMRYQNKTISADTTVTRYHACFSFLILSTKFESRYYVKGQHNAFVVAGAYSLITLLLGWWGLPWGPVYSVQSLANNFRGGTTTPVRSLLED
jgi:hypothetical protein